MRIVCVHRMTDYKRDDRLRKRCPNENIQKNQKRVPLSLQININVVSYHNCLTLHENEFGSFNILKKNAYSFGYLILHTKKPKCIESKFINLSIHLLNRSKNGG